MFFEDLPPGRREQIERELAAKVERDAVLPEFEQQANGTWVARKLGCIGVGNSCFEAGYDVNAKVDLAFGPDCLRAEGVREGMDALRPSMERILGMLGKKFG